MAPSLDGKISPVNRRGRGPFVMSRHEEDGKRMRALRASTDAVLVGGGNLREDDPDLAPAKLRVVVTRTGERIDPTAKMFDPALGGEAVVAHASSMAAGRRALLRPRATLVELGASEVDPRALLSWLARERGCRVVVCEGGGATNASFLAAHAVDEVRLTLVPRVLGGALAPGIFAGDGFEPDALPDARLVRVERVGDELFVVYAFDWGDVDRADAPTT
jgi:riboflavin-specific deaminase-like protein